MSRDTIDDFMNVPGADDLEDFGLSVEIVARGSDLAASLNDGAPYYEWDAQTTIDHLTENPDDITTFSTFNLPVCTLDVLGYDDEPMDIEPIDDDDCGAEVRTAFPS